MEILDFLKEWSPVIVPGLIVFFDVLLLLLKRKPQTIDDFFHAIEVVVGNLPSYINKVEVPGNGADKRLKVISLARKALLSILGRDLSVSEYRYFETTISGQIEDVLSTPQKKGGSK